MGNRVVERGGACVVTQCRWGRDPREGTVGTAARGRGSLSGSTTDTRCGRAAWDRSVRWAGGAGSEGGSAPGR